MADNFFVSLLVLYNEDVLEDGEFLLLVEEKKRPVPEFPYWKFPRFSLNDILEDECLAEFPFEKQEMPVSQKNLLILADTVISSQGLVDLSPKCPRPWGR